MNLEEELSKALADPDLMKKVGAMLGNLSQSTATDAPGEHAAATAVDGAENAAEAAAAAPPPDLSKLLGSLGGLGNLQNDPRTNLLMAIKPFLSEKRAPYMDSALSVLRLVQVGKIGKDLKLF